MALSKACAVGDLERCTMLLDMGKPHTPTRGRKPLYVAAMAGHLEVCRLLLDRGATHAPGKDGKTPLHGAAENGHRDVCVLLLERGAMNTVGDTRAATTVVRNPVASPLELAVANGHRGVCELLLDVTEPERLTESFCSAISKRRKQLVSLFMDRCATQLSTTLGEHVLREAVRTGNQGLCSKLLDRGAKQTPDRIGSTPLIIAAGRGNESICKLLLDRGATQTSPDNNHTPLKEAVERNCKNICKLLLSRGATQRPNCFGYTPLATAVDHGFEDMCSLLLDYGAARVQYPHTWHPLRKVIFTGNEVICELLLRRGIRYEITRAADEAWSAKTSLLWYAVERKQLRILKLLLEYDVIEKDIPASAIAKLPANVRAMLVQRLSPLAWVSRRLPETISSVAELIFYVHVLMPSKPRKLVLGVIYHKIITRDENSVLLTPPIVVEIIASMMVGKGIDYFTNCRAQRALTPLHRRGIVKGLVISKMIQSTNIAHSRSHPWWLWKLVCNTLYGVPMEWLNQEFWNSVAKPCTSPIVVL